jgi:2-(3-amino-3-carboxypropyl)histidine synthase
VHKTVWRLRRAKTRSLALQFPEGLLLFATTLADIFQTHCPSVEDVVILGDVTYGACCVDDYTAASLGCDFLVHYGHSCLVPVDVTGLPCLYVFVDIAFDTQHLVDCVCANFEEGASLVLAGTIQFASAIQDVRARLSERFPRLAVPQSKPLSPGEVLGCTAPTLIPSAGGEDDEKGSLPSAIVFVADGRFHLEAIMIANPTVPAFRYDPYLRALTEEEYAHGEMRAVRKSMVARASRAERWGVVLGTLGRQGNPAILEHLERRLRECGKAYAVFLISEMTPAKMAMLKGADAFAQIACPRLSIDWGEDFQKPVLTPYEAEVALGGAQPWWELPGAAEGEENAPYPMDYYSREGGPWTSAYVKAPPGGAKRKPRRPRREIVAEG